MRLLVIEDEVALGETVCAYLRDASHAADHVTDLASARASMAGTMYDLLLLDLGLPDGDGLTFLRALRHDGFTPPVLIATARDRISERIEGLKAGADDYLVKPFDLDEMVARIEANLSRQTILATPVRAFGDVCVHCSTKSVTVAGHTVDLTRREWGLIDRLSSRPDMTFSKSDLEDTLYGHGYEVESNAIEAHVSRLRAKLGKTAVMTVRGIGYKMGRT
ncbi:response regulator transcription factor [Celeribacter marinus]|uniref:DNA-binding response regulator n=1 Tax=Celeribacter marinus TaxID=1397108 RepID=A0A0N7HIV8_9RHOB|nr:response regulator transcription factor [Celeribacter marinus]ALI56301.1 DNA-binding response regulator [Celeribacter marinus]SFK82838.1 two component transcriptional regulator, winged helix family [Celeribacter marinus]